MSDQAKVTQFLAKVPLFSGLSARQLQALGERTTRRTYAAGEQIVVQGEGGIGLYVVLSGQAQAIHTRADGEEVTVNTFGPTDFFGELAMLNDEPRTASVTATEETACLILTRWEFLGKVRTDPEMAVTVLGELAKRFQRALGVL
ncbi:MAG: cyclic nucleotide-binding domain-containing protein [Anaerolineae bacterium]|nr:cyclic nucleotide-binding domain-containing protein [Anaerolineae bacterium]